MVHDHGRAVQTFIEFVIRRVANPDQFTFGIEQSSATSALDRGAGNFDIGGAHVAIEFGDFGVSSGRRLAVVATDAKNRLSFSKGFSLRDQWNASYVATGVEREQADVEIRCLKVDDLGFEFLFSSRDPFIGARKHFDGDASIGRKVAKQVPTGQYQRFSLIAINDSAGTDGLVTRIVDTNPNGGASSVGYAVGVGIVGSCAIGG